MSDWVLIDNPLYGERKPTPMKAACHDGTPCIDVQCACGGVMHIHESQVAAVPADAEIAARCKSCGKPLVFPPGYWQAAFRRLHEEGWVAE